MCKKIRNSYLFLYDFRIFKEILTWVEKTDKQILKWEFLPVGTCVMAIGKAFHVLDDIGCHRQEDKYS